MSTPEYDHERFLRYRGYNPKFYRRAMEKHRRAEAVAKARADAAKAAEAQRKREAFEHAMAEQEADRAKEAGLALSSIKPGSKTPAREIVAHVAALHGIPVAEIIGDSRKKDVVAARHAAIRAIRVHRPDLSFAQIGKAVNRDHTTIISSLKRTAKQGGSHV